MVCQPVAQKIKNQQAFSAEVAEGTKGDGGTNPKVRRFTHDNGTFMYIHRGRMSERRLKQTQRHNSSKGTKELKSRRTYYNPTSNSFRSQNLSSVRFTNCIPKTKSRTKKKEGKGTTANTEAKKETYCRGMGREQVGGKTILRDLQHNIIILIITMQMT